MATLFKNHFSDECLISYLDGELPFYRSALVRRHLARCWQCRLRLKEIEKQVLELTQAMREDTFPGPQRLVDARLKFLRDAEEIAGEASPAKPVPARIRASWKPVWAAACLLLLAGSWWMLRRPDRRPDTSPSVEIRQVELAEDQAVRGPAHQEFRVVVKQLRPVPVTSERRLELWSEPGRGRFTSQLSDSHGSLRHAMWQPEPERRYVYNPALKTTVVRWTGQEVQDRWGEFLFREGLTLEGLEAGLLKWLEDRPWRPISLSSSVSYLTTSDGAALRVTRSRTDAGEEILRLSALKSAGDIRVEFSIEVDGRTHVPRLQCIRYESPTRALELWLYPQPPRVVRAASFEPPASLSVAPVAPPLYAQRPPAVAESHFSPAPDPVAREVEIYYALHRLQACRGETVEVIRQTDGRFQVRGVVVDTGRREQLVAALAPLTGPLVAVDIKTAEEALTEIGPADVRTAKPPAAPPLLPRKEVMRSLARQFADEEAAARFADLALASSEEVMREAQALRQLGERFHGERGPHSTQARWLLEVMTYDHLRDLQAKLEAAEQLLKPPLVKMVGAAPAPRVEAAPVPGQGASEEFQTIFDFSRHLNDGLRALFEGDGNARPAGRLMLEILDALPRFQASVQTASDRALAASASKKDAATHNPPSTQ